MTNITVNRNKNAYSTYIPQCQSIRDELATCLSKSDCVLSGKTGQECLRDHMEELPSDCQAVYKSYVNCRRGLVSGEEDCWCEGCATFLIEKNLLGFLSAARHAETVSLS